MVRIDCGSVSHTASRRPEASNRKNIKMKKKKRKGQAKDAMRRRWRRREGDEEVEEEQRRSEGSDGNLARFGKSEVTGPNLNHSTQHSLVRLFITFYAEYLIVFLFLFTIHVECIFPEQVTFFSLGKYTRCTRATSCLRYVLHRKNATSSANTVH